MVVVFPNEAAVIRLARSALAELHDEWRLRRRYFSAESMAVLEKRTETEQAVVLAAR